MHLAALALLACSGGTDDTRDGPTGDTAPVVLDPMLTIGTGDVEYIPLEDGDEIFIVQGPQGGHHFDISFLVQGIEAGDPDDLFNEDNPTTVWRAFEEGVQIDVGIDATEGFDPRNGEPGVYQYIGRKLILDIPGSNALDGRTVDVEVEITDVNGVNLVDRRTVTAIRHPLNEF